MSTQTPENEYLVAIHDFKGRTEDEITLKKGDHILVLENDDEFGDGWYIGRNLSSKKAGLFPYVFTTALVLPTPAPLNSPKATSPTSPFAADASSSHFPSNSGYGSTSSLNIQHDLSHSASSNNNSASPAAKKPSFSKSSAYAQFDPVNDTLTDIDEAISEFNSANPSYDNILPTGNIKSSSSPVGPSPLKNEQSLTSQFSYVDIHSWTSEMVQEYFLSRGYDETVCACFLRHKITGSILLELDLAYLKEIDINSFGTRFEISKEIKILNQMANSSNSSANHKYHNTSNTGNLSKTSSMNSQHLARTASEMSEKPPSINRLSLLRTSFNDDFDNISGSNNNNTIYPYMQQAPQSAQSINSKRDSNSHKKDSSFDPNWVLPKAEPKSNSMDNKHLSEPAQGAQPRGRVRSSTISTADQYYTDNKPSPDLPPLPKYTPFSTHSRQVSSSSAGGHSRKSSYVEDTRARHSAHSRHASYDTVRESDPLDGTMYHNPVHSRSASASSMGFSDFKFLKPFTNGELPATFLEDEEQAQILAQGAASTPSNQHKRRSSIIASLIRPIKGDSEKQTISTHQHSGSVDSSVLSESAKLRSTQYESLDSNNAKSDPAVNNVNGNATAVSADSTTTTSTANITDGNDSSKRRPTLRSTSSNTNMRKNSTFASSKKKTSAFQEGILDIKPSDASKTADCSGWMSKRGSVAVGTWKSRYFTLHGTRLSYFTSYSDDRERGLIDITSHRVVPVGDEDKFVALYAASVGAGRFCFKVVPPQAGTAKGVMFTMPKVHYFAVETQEDWRKWMAALKKATIDRDDSAPVVSSCATPTIPLNKAQELLAEARAKEDSIRLQAIAASNTAEPEAQSTILFNKFGADPSTPDSGTNNSLTPSETGSSNTPTSTNKTKPVDYFGDDAPEVEKEILAAAAKTSNLSLVDGNKS